MFPCDSPPTASDFPSGEKATENTLKFAAVLRLAINFKVDKFHNSTTPVLVEELPPTAKIFPSGEIATENAANPAAVGKQVRTPVAAE
jgi:hypothetical protein